MNKYYLSLPSIVSSAGDSSGLLEALYAKKRCLKKKNIEGKEFCIGEVESLIQPLDFPRQFQRFYTRTNALLFEAMLKISPLIDRLKKENGNIGACIGTTTGGFEENYQIFIKNENFPKHYIQDFNSLSHPARFLKEFFSLNGVCFSISTACTSGLKSIIQGQRLLESGLCDYVIVGGVDGISTLSLFGFDSLGILSSDFCNPFSYYRNGINIGEGACLFVMSKTPLNCDVYLHSFASNNDAFHLTKQDEKSQKAIEAICKALGDDEVDYINLHATGTLANEISESRAIASVLPHIPASGIKGCIGHTLGATGAIEAGLCVLLLEQDHALLPPHIYDENYDKGLHKIALISEVLRKKIQKILSINFAFGGDNVAAIFGRDQ